MADEKKSTNKIGSPLMAPRTSLETCNDEIDYADYSAAELYEPQFSTYPVCHTRSRICVHT